MRYVKIGLIILAAVIVIELGLHFFYHPSKTNGSELVLYGNVDIRQVDISFRVSGMLEEVFFQEGDLVKKGDLMAALDTSPYSSIVELADAHLASVVAKYKNSEKLLENRLGVISTYAVSQENLDNAQANFESLEADVIAAEAELKIAVDNLGYTQVYAPNDGIILTRIKEPGSVVNVAEPVYTLSIMSPLWIRAYVDEPDLGKIEYGMSATITTDMENGKTYTGKIGFISPVAEFTPKSVQTTELRTSLVYRVRIYVDDPDGALKQGMPVTVKLRR